jgi:hypothetical protein
MTALNNLAFIENLRGNSDLAVSLYERVLYNRERELGESHPDTITVLYNLNNALTLKGDLESADVILKRIMKIANITEEEVERELEKTKKDMEDLEGDSNATKKF